MNDDTLLAIEDLRQTAKRLHRLDLAFAQAEVEQKPVLSLARVTLDAKASEELLEILVNYRTRLVAKTRTIADALWWGHNTEEGEALDDA